jgi:hypothetical protein
VPHSLYMDGPTGILIKLGVRLLVFGAVFFLAARRNPKIAIHARWATPPVALVFAMLNTGLYWALKPVLDLATLGALGFVMPLVVNTVLLVATVRFFAWEKLPRVKAVADAAKPSERGVDARPLFEIHGLFATLWMALILTVAHGALWVGLDYLPGR